ncbi:MAG TPA: DNA adenine methylase [Candidatus Angelobacter sp.]|nr:DNA adenine methylase [Candidatus Angelobacter sp.]
MPSPRLTRHYSPLRYPGGKGRLAGFVQRLFEDNKLVDGHYAEPYAGGAAVALSLLFMEYASSIHINDISKPVYYFWKAVLNETDELCRMIRDKQVTVTQWKRQRNILRDFRNHTHLEVAYSLFFLNRTNRSGIIHTGGMIGGNDQTGEWKLDARYNKPELISRIESIAAYSNRITVSNRDAEDFLSDTAPKLPPKTLIFLDPPYFEQGQSLYENHYQPEDHLRLSRMVKKKLKKNWIVSYDNHPEIRKAYKGCPKLTYSLGYSAARRYEGSEVIFFSDGLTVPNVQSPLHVKKR